MIRAARYAYQRWTDGDTVLALPGGRDLRIIALTAAAFPEDRARCLEAGMDDYVSKPVNLDELVGALRRADPPS